MYYSVYCENKQNKIALIKFLEGRKYKLHNEEVFNRDVFSLVIDSARNSIYLAYTEFENSFDYFKDNFEKYSMGDLAYHQEYFVYTDVRSYENLLLHLGFEVTVREPKRKLLLDL